MPRTVSSALSTELAKTITSVGYLVEIGTATPKRLSNIGTVSWNSLTWTESDFAIDGLAFDTDQPLTGSLVVQNLDGVMGAALLSSSEKMYSTVITVYQFARGALATADVPKVAVMAIATMEVSLERVSLSLVESKSATSFTPRRRVTQGFGFSFATAPGTTFQWGNEIIVLESANG
jgi:hypothetical protein